MSAVRKIKQVVKPVVERTVWRVRRPFAKVLNAGGEHYCPVCDSQVRHFGPYSNPRRKNARCPVCGSLERHRLDWLFLKQQTNLLDQPIKKMLHIAPEECLSARIRRVQTVEYLTADLSNPRAMVEMDITDIQYADESFDVIYCSHVLEHIQDDHLAMSELYRVLAKGGWAVLQVPITVEKTYEDPSITDPGQRAIHFGQWDHVRRCGPDYVERMRTAGFDAQVLRSTDIVPEDECNRLGFQPDRLIFYCQKAARNNTRKYALQVAGRKS